MKIWKMHRNCVMINFKYAGGIDSLIWEMLFAKEYE